MKKVQVFLVSVLITAICGGLNAQTIRYVKANGPTTAANAVNATSWEVACSDLQAVINVSASGDSIWVATGTYKPNRKADALTTITANNRDNAFVMKSGVHVYGSFVGTETSLEQRTFLETGGSYGSILSGDIGIANDSTDNCYHVVISAGDTTAAGTLDGFTITKGYANNSGQIIVNGRQVERDRGAGIFSTNSSLVLNHLSINNNIVAHSGGGIFNASSSPALNNVVICYNKAANNDGGGMYNSKSSPILTNVTISNNTASVGGAGMYNIASSSPQLVNVIIKDNIVTNSGGGMYNNASHPILTNVIISNNAAGIHGGGIYNYNSSQPILTNVTISNNKAVTAGAGVRNATSSSPKIRNSIIWGNTLSSGTISNVENSASNPTYSNSLVGGEPIAYGIILNGAPLFVDTITGDYRLQQGSPCINAGSDIFYSKDSTPNLSHIISDIAGNARSFGIVDLGAYEYIVHNTDVNKRLYVKENGVGNTNGSSWNNAMPQLADALEYAGQNLGSVEEIWVAAGVYKPLNKAGNGTASRDKAFVLSENINLYGGFAGGETSIDERDWESNQTILSGIMGNDTAYHVLLAVGEIGNVLMDGFTITQGNANGSGNITISGKNIPRNNAGAIYVNIKNSELALQNCNFVNNQAARSGGAVYCTDSSNISISDTKMENNQAGNYAGAFYNANTSQAKINRCLFNENTAKLLGGAIHSTGPLTVTNSLLTYNNSENGGAFDFYGKATLVNITMANNTATIAGGGIHIRSGNVNMQNSILYNNTADNNATINRDGGTLNISYCALNDATLPAGIVDSGNNLLDINLPFVDTAAGDFSLSSGSTCINAGNNNKYLWARNINSFENETDLGGNSRLLNGTIDLGAFESNATSLNLFVDNANMVLYPNPVQNMLYIQTSSEVKQITLYDISGRTVGENLRVCPKTTALDISHLANGIYLVKVKTKEGEIVRKIVKE